MASLKKKLRKTKKLFKILEQKQLEKIIDLP